MITSLCITDYRAFRSLAAEDIARVNLFIGKNGSGKTSALEAVAILAFGSDPGMLVNIALMRGEMKPHERERWGDMSIELDVAHFFHGHRLEFGSSFQVEELTKTGRKLRAEIAVRAARPGEIPTYRGSNTAVLRLIEGRNGKSQDLELSPWKGYVVNRPYWEPVCPPNEEKRVCFIPAEGLTSKSMNQLWSQVALEPEEQDVYNALRILEPQVEQIAFLDVDDFYSRRGSPTGIFARLGGVEERMPLGALGDGTRRLLGLSLAAIRSSKGFLMIDEIDTGLHYSMMSKMWEMVIQTAERKDVQVFATTHSLDCLNGLADLYREKPEMCECVRVNRIEKDLEKAIPYSAAEILTADIHRIEVR